MPRLETNPVFVGTIGRESFSDRLIGDEKSYLFTLPGVLWLTSLDHLSRRDIGSSTWSLLRPERFRINEQACKKNKETGGKSLEPALRLFWGNISHVLSNGFWSENKVTAIF
jgi:hypothetical protein